MSGRVVVCRFVLAIEYVFSGPIVPSGCAGAPVSGRWRNQYRSSNQCFVSINKRFMVCERFIADCKQRHYRLGLNAKERPCQTGMRVRSTGTAGARPKSPQPTDPHERHQRNPDGHVPTPSARCSVSHLELLEIVNQMHLIVISELVRNLSPQFIPCSRLRVQCGFESCYPLAGHADLIVESASERAQAKTGFGSKVWYGNISGSIQNLVGRR